MAVALDNIHINFRVIDGYNKNINIVISPRGIGKTSLFWLLKIYNKWKINNKAWIYLVRQNVEITEALLDSIQDTIINKFTDDNVSFTYSKGAFKDGIVDIFINDKLFFRVVSLSVSLRRIKLAVLKNIGGVLMDEYIIDPKTQEKYQTNEIMKIKEAYTTWTRESEGALKMYFLANPYSLYNPLFIWLKVPINKIKKGVILTGDIWALWCYEITSGLKEYLLKQNPLLEFDDEYKKYAFDGTAINDENIKVGKFKNNFALRHIFRVENQYLGIFQNMLPSYDEDKFFCKIIDNWNKDRKIYVFDFEDLINGCLMLNNDEKLRFKIFKNAMRRRQVSFEDVNSFYIAQEIFNLI